RRTLASFGSASGWIASAALYGLIAGVGPHQRGTPRTPSRERSSTATSPPSLMRWVSTDRHWWPRTHLAGGNPLRSHAPRASKRPGPNQQLCPLRARGRLPLGHSSRGLRSVFDFSQGDLGHGGRLAVRCP